jgi:deltex-like protein
MIIDSDDEEDCDRKLAAKNPQCSSDSDDRGTMSMPMHRIYNSEHVKSDHEVADRKLAEQLQRQENLASEESETEEKEMVKSSEHVKSDHEVADRELAEQLQRQENLASKERETEEEGMAKSSEHVKSNHEVADWELAEQLQRQENLASEERETEEEGMAKSSDGKAVLAVQEIIALVKSTKEMYLDGHPALKTYCIDAVTIDDMVFFAKNMLDLQEEFIRKGVSGYIDVGYHYTVGRNMDNIRTHGLLTSSDRQTNQVQAIRKGGSAFGDGIYTANNGTSFSNYGDTGLIVGRLKGKMVRACLFSPPINQTIDANTIVGDKLTGLSMPGIQSDSDGWPLDDSYHEIVLRSSAQCLPIIKFDKALRQNSQGEECIRHLKKELESILNRLFNKGQLDSDIRNAPLVNSASLSAAVACLPSIPTVFPPAPLAQLAAASTLNPLPARWTNYRQRVRAHHNLHAMHMSLSQIGQTLNYRAPQSLTAGVPSNALMTPPASCNQNDKCVICHDRLNRRQCVALSICNHVFHNDCIQLAFKSKPQCPVCRVPIGEPKGTSPSGTMAVSIIPTICSGFQENSILITYNIPSGTQLSYHDRPGQRHSGKFASAYLPNNSDGQNLLKRLKYSFLHGLSFTIGTSMTTGLADQCTWASIHHKTSPSGGARIHGFPDPDYFDNCNGELDDLCVPSSRDLNDDGMVIACQRNTPLQVASASCE